MAGAFNWNGPTPMGLASYVQQQGDFGRQRGEDSRLARLVSGAMVDPSKRQANLAEVASFRPDAAFAAQGQFDQQEDVRNKRLGEMATIYVGAPASQKAAILQQFAPELSRFGMQIGPDFAPSPEIDQMAAQLARVYGDDNSSELPADIRSLEYLKSHPELLELNDRYRGTFRFDQQFDAQGNPIYNALNNRTGQAAPADVVGAVRAGGGGNAAPAPADAPAGSPAPSTDGQMPDVSDLVGNGVVMTSWRRSQEDNARVDGKANSRHLEGQGVDFVVPQAQKAEWTRRAQAKGLQVIDEGDHMHVQVPRAGAQGAPVLGQSDADRAAAAAQKVRAEETARRQLALEYAGPEADAAADAARKEAEAKAGVERGTAARVKAPQINNVVRGISRIDAAMKALDQGLLTDSGPIDQYALRFTQSGQELEAAVGAIKNDLLSLTRVPGVGSQSDLEQRIADLKYPQLGFHPEVNRRNLEQLRDFIRDVEESISGGAQQPAAPAADDDEEALIGKYL